tara:strand:- start:1881 stop:2870 length:990 start_codon:yes stop_codon:yes gene_type:complete
MGLLNFPRQIGLKRTRCYDRDSFTDYIDRLNGKTNIYTSLYSFTDPNDYDSVIMDRAWWDFDMTEEYDMDCVKKDVAALIKRLDGDVRLVATGRGFHVHQVFKRSVKGRQWAFHLDRYEREMALGLASLDGVGYPEKLTRVSMTYNNTRNKWAVPIQADLFSIAPLDYRIPVKPLHWMRAIDPFVGDIDMTECFDIVRWNADNPYVEIESQANNTVKVGHHGGEVALPTCLNRAVRVSNPPHHVRVALVQTMAQQLRWFADPEDLSQGERDEIADNICDFIISLKWTDYRPAITNKYVRGMMMYKRAPSKAWYSRHNLCNGEDCWFCSK